LELDRKDRQILQALQRDRMHGHVAAAGVGLASVFSPTERVRKLEAAGVITGYGAHVDARAVGLELQAIVRLRTTHQHIKRCVQAFEALPEVVEAFRGLSDWQVKEVSFEAWVKDLERVVDAAAAYGSVATALVLSHPVRKGLPVP